MTARIHEHRGLKGRNKGRPSSDPRARRPTRRVPIPPELVVAAARAPRPVRHGSRRPSVPQRERQPDPAVDLVAGLAEGPRLSLTPAQLGTPLLQPPLRSPPLGRYLAAEFRGTADRGRGMGRAQRRGADARLRQVHDRAGGRVDQPHGRGPAPGGHPARAAGQGKEKTSDERS